MIDELVKTIKDMSGSYTPYQIFCDWVKMSAISVQNACCIIHDNVWNKREQEYKDIMIKYDYQQQQMFSKMLFWLEEELSQNMTDVLGNIFMAADCGNKQTMQFFSPSFISSITTGIAIPEDVSREKPLLINEPSVGSGGMIIAIAKELYERGINYQDCMKVFANDLDWNGVYMSYLQFSLLGIDAKIVQKDTLEPKLSLCPKERVLYTPKKMGVLI